MKLSGCACFIVVLLVLSGQSLTLTHQSMSDFMHVQKNLQYQWSVFTLTWLG